MQARQSFVRPQLKELITEATGALARLDGDRLDALVATFRALSCDFDSWASPKPERLAAEVRDAAREIIAFAHVLEETQANLRVISLVTELRTGLRGYGPQAGCGRPQMETTHGDN
jgi:hypothetical protein